jgi:serine/threonine protein phosphatase PrpC
MTCGCTALVMLVIESKVYTFHVGDCKSYLFRNEVLYKMNIDHLPVLIVLQRVEEIKEIGYRMLVVLCNMID